MKHQILSVALTVCLCTASGFAREVHSQKEESWKPILYKVKENAGIFFRVERYANPFAGSFRSILNVADELKGLQGIRLTNSLTEQTLELDFSFSKPARLLVAVAAGDTASAILARTNMGQGQLLPNPVLRNALEITELPAMDVYAFSYSRGRHCISIPQDLRQNIVILGAIEGNTELPKAKDIQLADATDYASFIIEGFSEAPALFSIVGGEDNPVVDEGMPGTEGIRGGFEGGACIKLGNTYHMFPTERAGEAGMPAIYDRIKTRIGHWTSQDAVRWTRQSTLYQSSGKYAVSHEDNPANDRRAAIWSYMPIFNKDKNRWQGHYLAYTCDKDIYPNHSFGRIWRCESTVEGMEGIDGPYKDCSIVIEPGLDSQLWEGRQGVASFFPYQVGGKWYSFYSGAFPFATRADYPYNGKSGAWYVGLAQADNLEGPWTRMSQGTVNPITTIHPKFVENPIVSQLPGGIYIAIFDGGPAIQHKLPNMIGYTLSKDGLHWSTAHYLPIDIKVKKWWHTMRTPLCLIPEGDDIYTIIYAAIADKRFHPMGLVRVKLNRKVLEEVVDSL